MSEWVPIPEHPDHPPLDYQELLGLEEMGIRDYPIGKLKLKVDIRQLLDGYEPIEVRQRRRMGDRDLEIDDREGMPGIHVNIVQENRDSRSKTLHQHGRGDNVAGDLIKGDKRVEGGKLASKGVIDSASGELDCQ